MSEWLQVKLERIAELSKRSWKVGDAPMPYIGLEHIEEAKLRLNGIGHSDNVASNKYLFSAGNTLFGKLRPYFRKVVKPDFDGVCSTDIWVVMPKSGIDEGFVFYFFANRELVDLSYSASSGTRMPRADWDFLKETEWPLPPLSEQKAITAVLSSLDDKIDLLHRQNKTLEALAQTLFRHWFIDDADDDWEIVTVGDFTEINASTVQKDYNQNLIEYLDKVSITEGKIKGFQQYALKDAPSRAKRLVKHNDVIYSTVRPNQKHYGIIKHPQPNLVVSTGFSVLTCDKIDPHFVYILLTQPDMTEYLHSIAEGSTSTYPSLKPVDLANVEFQLPPKEKLEDFSKITRDSWAKIHLNQNQIRTLEKLRDTLLPKLMSGAVRVRL